MYAYIYLYVDMFIIQEMHLQFLLEASCTPKACASKMLVHEQLADALIDTYQDILIV